MYSTTADDAEGHPNVTLVTNAANNLNVEGNLVSKAWSF